MTDEGGGGVRQLLNRSWMPLKETLLYTFISHDFDSPAVSWLLNIIHEDDEGSSSIFSQLRSCPQLKEGWGGRGRRKRKLKLGTELKSQPQEFPGTTKFTEEQPVTFPL